MHLWMLSRAWAAFGSQVPHRLALALESLTDVLRSFLIQASPMLAIFAFWAGDAERVMTVPDESCVAL